MGPDKNPTKRSRRHDSWHRRLTAMLFAIALIGLAGLSLTWPPTGALAAGGRVRGHMKPLASEMLDRPIHLECGVTVNEWRGYPRDEGKIQRLCLLATDEFMPFVAGKGLKPTHNRPFQWSAALLPNGECYRCLNDETWRFARRAAHGNLTGYTSFTNRYSFLLGNTRHREFDVTWVHELFHAQSYYYGLFDRHADDDAERVRIDERLAVEFTESLGLGR
jgi:hypothetical protein